MTQITLLKAGADSPDGQDQTMATVAGLQARAGLELQTHALAVLQQPNVNLSAFERLSGFEHDINESLGRARGNARQYLDVILPSSIATIVNIEAYYTLHNVLPQVLDENTSKQDAILLLSAMREQSEDFQQQASRVQTHLVNLRGLLSDDARAFADTVNKLNVAVAGDNGELQALQSEINGFDGKIAAASAGIALSGLAVVGGVFLVVVGSVAGFVTAGTSFPLVVGGGALVAGGVAGAVGSSIALAGLLKAKGDMISRREQLTREVQFATGLLSGYSVLADGANAAQGAAQDMANAWSLLDGGLVNLIDRLKKAELSVGQLRALFARAASADVANVLRDVALIKAQVAAPQRIVSSDTPVTSLIEMEATRLAA